MKTRPLASSDIPSCFDLSAYDVCAGWGVREWSLALNERYFMRLMLKLDEGESSLIKSTWILSERCFINPQGTRNKWLPSFSGAATAVRDLNAMEFFEGHHVFSDERYAEFSSLAAEVFGENYPMPEVLVCEAKLKSMPAWKMHQQAGVHNEKFMVAVELGASDEMIVQHFKDWLKTTRKRLGSAKIKSAFTPQDFATWHEKRLLPYLDLTYWAQVRGHHFTLPVLADTLFPNVIHIGVEDRIRKVVAPGAEFIVSAHVMGALNVQAHAEQNKDEIRSGSD
jgi:hypothetical protein